MRSIIVNTNSPCTVFIGNNLLEKAACFLPPEIDRGHILVVSDENSDSAACAFCASVPGAERISLPAGESGKCFSSVEAIIEKLSLLSFPRNGAVVSVGGGAVSDASGFASSIYMRGIPFIAVPTTLLAAVDASVGGKNGIDFCGQKNLVGTFWQPESVIIDCDVIGALPKEVLADGFAEVIKYGVLFDKEFFSKISSGFSPDMLEDIIAQCCEYKAGIVSADERDEGERHLLNLGHTVAHAIEKASGFTVSHGKAVGLGMVITSRGAFLSGYTSVDISRDIARALKKYGLPVKTDILPYLIVKNLKGDKKSTSDGIDEIFPAALGECVIKRITYDELSRLVLLGMGA